MYWKYFYDSTPKARSNERKHSSKLFPALWALRWEKLLSLFMDFLLLFRRVKCEIYDNWIHVTVNFDFHGSCSFESIFNRILSQRNDSHSFKWQSICDISREKCQQVPAADDNVALNSTFRSVSCLNYCL